MFDGVLFYCLSSRIELETQVNSFVDPLGAAPLWKPPTFRKNFDDSDELLLCHSSME